MKKSDLFSREMASSSSHTNNDNGIPLATLLEWYKIRDTFFGENCVSRNIPLSIKMASSCQHPDARWLSEVCAGKDVTAKEDAKRVFSALGQNDARALCFCWVIDGNREDLTPLRRSAELGFALAQALMARQLESDDGLSLPFWVLNKVSCWVVRLYSYVAVRGAGSLCRAWLSFRC
jgi:hypothetical protein